MNNKYRTIDLQAALWEINPNATFSNSAKWEEELTAKGIAIPTEQEIMTAWATIRSRKAQEDNSPSKQLLAHLEKEGFNEGVGVQLLLLRKQLKVLGDANVISTNDINQQPRLRDTYEWLNQQYAKAQAGNTNFDPKPYTFAELMAE